MQFTICPRPSTLFALCALFVGLTIQISSGFPLGKRLYRSLPSVSDNHYSEVFPDGTYKYAYTGEDSYKAERRLPDGTVEGETVYVRPDGIPVKVHYFADANGYRPKTDILYAERLVKNQQNQNQNQIPTQSPVPTQTRVQNLYEAPKQKVIVPTLVYKEIDAVPAVQEPSVFLAPPTETASAHHYIPPVEQPVAVAAPAIPTTAVQDVPVPAHEPLNIDHLIRDDGHDGSGDISIAAPSVTAIVGPGGHAVITPEALAKTETGTIGRDGKRLRNSNRRRGGKAIAKPSVVAVIGPGGTVTVAPKATALTNSDDGSNYDDLGSRSKFNYYESQKLQQQQQQQPLGRPVPLPVVPVVQQIEGPRAILEEIRPLAFQPVQAFPSIPASYSNRDIDAIKSHGALIIAPKASYSYEYAYSSPDEKHPSYGLNRAYVNVKVNQ